MPILHNSFFQASSLPPEVLITIFEMATYNSTRDIDYLVELPPFESIYAERRERDDKEALRTKHALSLTCSLFRRLTMRLLYEDICIRHGSGALLEILQGSKAVSSNEAGLGKFVKRVTLAPGASGSTAEDTPRILSLCPNIRVLSRPVAPVLNGSDDLTRDDSNVNSLSFSKLHRVDWTSSLSDEITASRLSPRFVWNSPILRVLSLNTDNLFIPERDTRTDEEPEVLINLPQVHTLRLRSCDSLGDPEEFWYSVQLPSLCRIVLERPLALYALHSGCLALYGAQITTFELGRYTRFLRIDAISIALGYCPNVETLLFPVFTTMPPAKNKPDTPRSEWLNYRVKRIGLNASVEENCDYHVSRTWMWVQLEDLVSALFAEDSRFKALERITLYGTEWRELVQDEAFKPIAKAIHSNRINIDFEDGVTERIVGRLLSH